jgi:hypothetical protein
MRFAREHRARPRFARESDGSVFFYRDDYRGTERWLVDSRGEVLDVEHFPASAGRAEKRDRPPTRDHPIDRS